MARAAASALRRGVIGTTSPPPTLPPVGGPDRPVFAALAASVPAPARSACAVHRAPAPAPRRPACATLVGWAPIPAPSAAAQPAPFAVGRRSGQAAGPAQFAAVTRRPGPAQHLLVVLLALPSAERGSGRWVPPVPGSLAARPASASRSSLARSPLSPPCSAAALRCCAFLRLGGRGARTGSLALDVASFVPREPLIRRHCAEQQRAQLILA